MRVRFSYLTDDDIRDMAHTYGRLRVIDGEHPGRCRMTTPTPTRTGQPRLPLSPPGQCWRLVRLVGRDLDRSRTSGRVHRRLHLPVLDVTIGLAWLMPIAVDGYVVVALVLWMAPVPARVAHFAKVNTYAAAAIGVAAQSAYHALTVWSAQPVDHREAWRAVLAAIVGALPPAVAGLAVHMRALIRRESQTRPTVSVAQQPPSPVVASAGEPAPTVEQPAEVQHAASGPAREPALVPVPASAFTRVNGAQVVRR